MPNATTTNHTLTPTETIDQLSAKAAQAATQAKDVAFEAARQAKNELNKAKYQIGKFADRGEKLAKENPWAAAATMFGVGALIGAIAVKLFSPKPTVGSVLGTDRIPDYARSQMKRQMKAFKKLF